MVSSRSASPRAAVWSLLELDVSFWTSVVPIPLTWPKN